MSDLIIPHAGDQRLGLEQLHAWENLRLGMFIHFGMSTFDGDELSRGDKPSTVYAPDRLDVDQWISVARDAGMKYAVLTTKHVAGHCLWPTRYNDYHVGTSGNKTDVVEEFVKACHKHGLMPGLYYCAWDNHNVFGSVTPSMTKWEWAFTTQEYQQFQWRQIDELMDRYGEVGIWWMDIPKVLPRDYRQKLYTHIAGRQPEALIFYNNGIGDGSNYPFADAWPSDGVMIERFLPNSQFGHQPWREFDGKKYYMVGEVCDPIGKEWFFVEGDQPRSDGELLGMYLTATSRRANLLLDVPPNRHGVIPQRHVEALLRLRKNIAKLGL